jgi:hypothetical protein
VNLVTTGYALECANAEKKKPEFSVNSWTFGLKSLLVPLVYELAFVGIILALFGIILLANGIDLRAALRSSVQFIIPTVILGLLLLPLVIFSLLRFAKTGGFSESFRIGKILGKAYKLSYIWLLFKGLLGCGLIISVFGFVPVVGWAVGGFVSQVALWTYLGSNTE